MVVQKLFPRTVEFRQSASPQSDACLYGSNLFSSKTFFGLSFFRQDKSLDNFPRVIETVAMEPPDVALNSGRPIDSLYRDNEEEEEDGSSHDRFGNLPNGKINPN